MKVITQNQFNTSVVFYGDLVSSTPSSVTLSNWIKIEKKSKDFVKIIPEKFAANGFYEEWTDHQKDILRKCLEEGRSPSELAYILGCSAGIYEPLILVTSEYMVNKNPCYHVYYECSERMIESLNSKIIYNEKDGADLLVRYRKCLENTFDRKITKPVPVPEVNVDNKVDDSSDTDKRYPVWYLPLIVETQNNCVTKYGVWKDCL